MDIFIRKAKQGLSAHINHNCAICPYSDRSADCLDVLLIDAYHAIVNLDKRNAAIEKRYMDLKMQNAQVQMEVDNEK